MPAAAENIQAAAHKRPPFPTVCREKAVFFCFLWFISGISPEQLRSGSVQPVQQPEHSRLPVPYRSVSEMQRRSVRDSGS